MALSVTNSHLMIFPPGTPPLILALNNKQWIDSQDKRDLLAPMMARDILTPVGRIVHTDGKVLTIRKYDLEGEKRPIRCAAIHLLKATGYGTQTLVGIGLTPLALTVAAVALLVLGYPTVALIGFGEALLFLALTIGDFRSKQGLFATGKARCIHEFNLFREFWSLNAQRVWFL